LDDGIGDILLAIDKPRGIGLYWSDRPVAYQCPMRRGNQLRSGMRS